VDYRPLGALTRRPGALHDAARGKVSRTRPRVALAGSRRAASPESFIYSGAASSSLAPFDITALCHPAARATASALPRPRKRPAPHKSCHAARTLARPRSAPRASSRRAR
jgi:hypothetical protein